MIRAAKISLIVCALWSQTAGAQVVSNATKAMGIEGLNSIHYYGVAQNGNLGQNNNSNQPWPMAGANDYVRTIDFTQPASRATWMNYAVAGDRRRGDADARPAEHHTAEHGLGAAAGNLDHAVGIPERRRGEQGHRAAAEALPGGHATTRR